MIKSDILDSAQNAAFKSSFCLVASPKLGNYGYSDETKTVDPRAFIPPAKCCVRPVPNSPGTSR